LLKKHLFLVVAIAAVAVAVLLGATKILTSGSGGSGGGPPGMAKGGPGGGGGPRGIVVTPAVVEVRSFSDRIEVLGAAKARQSITVTAPASQLVTRINFQSGQFVRQGQILAELNAREQDAGILQAQSQVALAKSNWDRWQQLADQGIAPAATAEQYKAQYDQALAGLEASQARAGDRVIRAPFSGVIGLTDAAPGMMLSPGGAIATLDDVSTIIVDFPISERYISLLRDGLPITATADAYPGVTFSGQVARLDTRLDPATRAITARAEFPNADGRLKPGMLMRVVIAQATRENPAVPESSVVFEGGEAYVLMIVQPPQGAAPGDASGQPGPAAQRTPGGGGGGGGAGMRAVQRTIQTGVRQGGWVEVLAGLDTGDRVVADGTNRVRPNDPISIVGGGQGGPGAPQGARPPGQPTPAPTAG